MPAVVDGVADFDGSRVTVAQHPTGAVVAVSVLTPNGRESTSALVQNDDRRRIGEAVLGEPVLTRTELVGLLDLNPCEGAVRTLDAEGLAAAVQTLTEDAQRAATRAAEHESQAERAVQALADLTEASQQLEAEVVVRRSDLPDAHRNPADPERIEVGERTYTTSGGWNADRHRAEGLERLAVAALLDREGAEEARQQAEDERLAAALQVHRPAAGCNASALDVVRAMRAAGWTPPAPTEDQTT